MRVTKRCVAIGGVFAACLLAGCGGHTISGIVTGAVSEGVVVALGGFAVATTTTAADGSYRFSDLEDGAYILTASAPGHTLAPESRRVTVDGENVAGQDFVATALPGTLDARFGTVGTLFTDFGVTAQTSANALAIQPDGKIVTAGWSSDGTPVFALARYQAEGTLDASFGASGRVTTGCGTACYAFAVALQPDGRIVAAGRAYPEGEDVTFAVARYETDGRLDDTFGSGGLVTTALGGSALGNAVAIQADGKIVVAGGVWTSPDLSTFALVRYEADGRLDANFGSDGIVTTGIGAESSAHGVAVQADGKIVAAGWTRANPSDAATRTVVARFDPDGTLDAGFGTGGTATPPAFVAWGSGAQVADDDAAWALALQADGKIVTAGHAGQLHPSGSYTHKKWFALARWNADGSIDTGFAPSPVDWLDSSGTLSVPFGQEALGLAVAVQANGEIVTAGVSDAYHGDPSFPTRANAFAVARCNPDGSLDPSFGAGGRVTTFVLGGDAARAVAIQPDGKIVAAGDSMGLYFSLARYWP